MPARPDRDEMLAAGFPEEAVQFFQQGWDSIARVQREAEARALRTSVVIQEALDSDVTPDAGHIYRMLEGAANFAQVQEFESLVDRFLTEVDPNRPLHYFKRTPFQLAAGLCSIQAMKQLLGRGAIIDSSALHQALRSPQCVTWLLGEGANVESTDEWGVTCLMHACLRGWTETAAVLVTHGVSIDAQEAEGRTALWFSSRNRRQKCVELLLAAGANPNLADHYGRTPLMRAKNLTIANMLLAAGANPGLTDNEGQTAYELAGGRWEFREILSAAVQGGT